MLLLVAVLVPCTVQAETALEWLEVDKPGLEGNVVVTPSEVSEIAIGSSGVLYAIDSENSKVYRSLDAGVSWEDITSYLADAGAELPVTKIAVAPDKPGTVAVVTDGRQEVYVSEDGGDSWIDTRLSDAAGWNASLLISDIAISLEYGGERDIAIGTRNPDGSSNGDIWVIKSEFFASWKAQELDMDVTSVCFSPDYDSDKTILVIASDIEKTYLYTGIRDTDKNSTDWEVTAPKVEINEVGEDSPGESEIIFSDLALPSDYSGDEAESRFVYAAYSSNTTADDVYRIEDTDVFRLDVNHGSKVSVASIAYYGTTTSGKLLAGEVNPVDGSLTVQVWRTTVTDDFDPSSIPPTWYPSTVPPTGPGNAKVGWSPDGEIAYCGTSKPPGTELPDEGRPDESALSASLDGDRWRQMGLVDTTIKLADIVPAPDSKSLFITTYSDSGPEGIWRSAGSRLGKHWHRLLAIDTLSDAVILRLSPNYSDDYTIYAAEVGGTQIAVSHDRGNSWRWRRAPGQVIDMVVGDEETVYVALAEGYIAKSIDGARTWLDPVETTLADINMLAIVDNETILVGGRNGEVDYSTDGGTSFNQIGEAIGSGGGDVQVVADVNFSENDIIYAATNLPDEGLWRWVIGVSTEWEQIDEDITELAEGQRISGLAVGPEGTLYVLRLEPASDTTGGMTRWLCPSCCQECMDFEYDFINFSLPQGATFNSTAVFPNTLPYLKLSGDAEQNDLWTVDTASQTIYRFQDTLCKFGPSLDAPPNAAVLSLGPCPCERPPRLILEWEELEDVTEYEVAMYLDADSASEVWTVHSDHEVVIATGGNYPASLSSGSAYYWKVRTTEPIKSPWSEMRSFALTLMEVEGLYPAPSATGVSVRPAFTWDSVAKATGYEFLLARDYEFTDVVVDMTGTDALQTTAWGCDRDLDYATTYFWKVRAISATSYSEWGTGVFTTRTAPIAPPPSHSSSPPSLPEPMPSVPFYLPIIIGLGVTLVIVLLVLIVRTGR